MSVRWSRRTVLSSAVAAAGLPRMAGAQVPRNNVLCVIVDSLPATVVGPHARDTSGDWAACMPRLAVLAGRSFVFERAHAAHPEVRPGMAALMTGRPGSETGALTGGLPVHPELPLVLDAVAERHAVFSVGRVGLPRRRFGARVEQVLGDLGTAELGAEASVRALRGWLAGRPPGQPWLGVVGLRGLTALDHPVELWRGLDRVPDLGLPERERPAGLPAGVPEPEPKLLKVLRAGAPDPEWPAGMDRHYLWLAQRMLGRLDRWIGSLVDVLDDSVHADTTTVVVTAACGHPLGAHRLVRRGGPYCASVEVPLLVRGGAVGRSDALVSGLDLAPTICDLMGVAQLPHARGYSLRPLLTQQAGSWRREVVWESQVEGRTVRSAEFAYTRFRDDPLDLLFHMGNDPLQQRDLARNTGYAATVEDHRARLTARESALRPCALSEAGWAAARGRLGLPAD